jgi:hypothetical protein
MQMNRKQFNLLDLKQFEKLITEEIPNLEQQLHIEKCGCSAKAMGEALSISSSRDRRSGVRGTPSSNF